MYVYSPGMFVVHDSRFAKYLFLQRNLCSLYAALAGIDSALRRDLLSPVFWAFIDPSNGYAAIHEEASNGVSLPYLPAWKLRQDNYMKSKQISKMLQNSSRLIKDIARYEVLYKTYELPWDNIEEPSYY